MNGRKCGLFLLCAAVLLSGCVRGDRLVSESHAAYNEALRTRFDEELLLNLVRLRYRDRPLFLGVSSVIARFEREAGLGVQGSFDSDLVGSGRVNVNFDYAEQPTVTFTPLQGEEFAERLLRPVDLDTITLLERSGWSIERVLRLTVQRMNGLDNAASASGPTPAKAPGFRRFIEASQALKQLQDQRAVVLGSSRQSRSLSNALPAERLSPNDVLAAARAGYRFEVSEDGQTAELRSSTSQFVIRVAAAQQESESTQRFREVLGLRPDVGSYRLVSAAGSIEDILGQEGQRERIVLVTRSLLGTLFFLCHAVDVPSEHSEQGIVTVTREGSGELFDWGEVTDGLLRIQSSESRPRNASVRVPYRGYWFYIADDDLNSKSTFALLTQLYALQSGDPIAGSSPVPTLPLGG